MNRKLNFESTNLSKVLSDRLIEMDINSIRASELTGIDKKCLDDIISSKTQYTSYTKLVMLSNGLKIPMEPLYIYCNDLSIKINNKTTLFSFIFYKNFNTLLKIFDIGIVDCVELLIGKKTVTANNLNLFNGTKLVTVNSLFKVCGLFSMNPKILFRNYLSVDNIAWEINEPDVVNNTFVPSIIKTIRIGKDLTTDFFRKEGIMDGSTVSRIDRGIDNYTILNFIDYCNYMGLEWENLLIGNKTKLLLEQSEYIHELNILIESNSIKNNLTNKKYAKNKEIPETTSTTVTFKTPLKLVEEIIVVPDPPVESDIKLELRCKIKVKCFKGDFNDESDLSDLSQPYGYYWERADIREDKLDIFKNKFNESSFSELKDNLKSLLYEEFLEAKFEITVNSYNCSSKMNFSIK